MFDDSDNPPPRNGEPTGDSSGTVGVSPDGTSASSFTVEDVLNRSWEILRSYSGQYVVIFWFGIFLGFVPLVISFLLTIDQRVPRQPPPPGVRILDFLALGVSMLVYAGLTLFVTKVASGQKAGFGDLFRCRKYALTILFAYFLVAVIGAGFQFLFLLGTMLLGEILGDVAILIGFFAGIPLLYAVTISLSQVPFLIVDRETSAIGAIKLSWALMRGHRLQYFFLTFCCGCINLLGLLAFGFGLLITFPYQLMCMAVFYLAVSGQPVADPFGWSGKPAIPQGRY